MAYRNGDRYQQQLFPKSIEDYVKPDDPVRAYDAFVEALDFKQLGIELDENKVGNSQYNPKTMLKILIYGTAYGFRSSRKLERAINHNISFIWLSGGLTPDHKTISEFRRKHKSALKKVLRQLAKMCINLGLIEGNTLFVDGTKIRASASIKNSWTKDKCAKYLKNIDARIKSILDECDRTDEAEQNCNSLVTMDKELENKEILKRKVESILKEIEQTDKKTVNTVDSECCNYSSIQGSHAGYNAQSVVDEKHGLIVNTDVVNENNDLNQFAEQVNQANKIIDNKCEIACADAGYFDTDELEKIDKQNIKVIVPTKAQASKKECKPFSKERFKYDQDNDCYICPEGKTLRYSHIQKKTGNRVYRITEANICHNCSHYKECTGSRDGRTIGDLDNAEVRRKLEKQYETSESQQIYKLRKCKVELPFGHIKRNLGVSSFLLRGLDGVKAEMAILATCFNLARMISIFGINGIIEKLRA